MVTGARMMEYHLFARLWCACAQRKFGALLLGTCAVICICLCGDQVTLAARDGQHHLCLASQTAKLVSIHLPHLATIQPLIPTTFVHQIQPESTQSVGELARNHEHCIVRTGRIIRSGGAWCKKCVRGGCRCAVRTRWVGG